MQIFLTTYRGELAALSAALIWAIASYIYAKLGKTLLPLVLNLVKSAIAIGFILLTLGLRGDFIPDADWNAWLLLTLSGIIGIGIGDTAFFEALNCLGARRGLLLEALAPPLAALLAFIFLQEKLPLIAWIGIALTVTGVCWVVMERVPDAIQGSLRPVRGVIFGLVAAFSQAAGSVLSRAALAETTVSPLWSSLFRLTAGVLALLVWIAIRQQARQGFAVLRSPRLLMILTGAAFASTFLAIWLQQTAYKYTATGIAQSLTSTSPLFAIPIALLVGERVSPRAILGVLVAFAGIRLLFT